jgi:Cell Wall Hydrolase
MQAVAGVFQNRANSDFNNYGGDLQSQLMAPAQIQGWQTPSPAAIAVAQDLQNGTLADPTGGATYYANPGASTAGWDAT